MKSTITFFVLLLALSGCSDDVTSISANSNSNTGNRIVLTNPSPSDEKSEFDVEEDSSYCVENVGCNPGDTCFEGTCESSCFDQHSCGEDETCRWGNDGAVECLEPWTCELSNEQIVSSTQEALCRVSFACDGEETRNYSVECRHGTCSCLEDDKIVGSFGVAADGSPYLVCGTFPSVVSAFNTRCGWAILPN